MAASTTIAGIHIPSTDPVFLGIIIGIHIPLGILCLGTGAVAMLSRKGRGRHSTFGTIYFWCLSILVASAAFLSIERWTENRHLFSLGLLAFMAALSGRFAHRQRWRYRTRLHITGMGLSYILIVVAFYVDNGKQLPIWKSLPHFTYWLLPIVVGSILIGWALLRHPLRNDPGPA